MTRDLFRLFDQNDVGSLVSSEPQSLQDMSEDEAEQDLIIRRADSLIDTQLRVDYSDFANHVFFNSALDYFNITGEKILNEYPYGGTRAELEAFMDDLDGYQRHVLSRWPSRLGHLRIDPSVSASYVQVDDVGQEGGVTKTSLLSPGTGSISVEVWYNSGLDLTGSENASVLIQKKDDTGSERSYTLYLSGSQVMFRVVSGSSETEVAAPAHVGTDGYVLGVLDRTRTSGTLLIYTGTLGRFPTLVQSASVTFGEPLYIGSSSLYIGSGTITGKTMVPFSGALDDVRVWRVPVGLGHITSSYNRKVYARSSLVGLWRFNETGSTGLPGLDSVALDHAGHGLNGRIRNYWSGVRGSGSLFYEIPDPIIEVRTPEVLEYIAEWQTSGSDYDSSNGSKITDLVPAAYLETDSDQDADLVKNFLYILARHYDRLKLYIEHLQYLTRTNYTEFDQVPDAQLEEMARFFGFDLPGGFSNSTAIQYFLGRDVQLGELSNDELDEKLYEIKAKFWRRLMNNLAHVYKTKGTRESVQALMRSYGVNEGFVRLKEYGYTSRNKLSAQRIHAEKSDWALGFGSGSLSGSVATLALSGSAPAYEDSSGSVVQTYGFGPVDQPFPNSPLGVGLAMGDSEALPTYIFPFQETGGSTITDVVTGLTGTNVSTRTFIGHTASIYWSGSWTSKRAITNAYWTPGIRTGDVGVFSEFGTSSFGILLVEKTFDRVSTTGIIGKRTVAGSKGFWLEKHAQGSSGPGYQFGVQFSSTGSTQINVFSPSGPAATCHLFVVDRTAHQIRYYSPLSGGVADISGHGGADLNAPTEPFYFDGSRGTAFCGWGQRFYLAIFTGSNAERLNQSHLDNFWRQNRDSTGLLTSSFNNRRTGDIGYIVSDDDEHGDVVSFFRGARHGSDRSDRWVSPAYSLPSGSGPLQMAINGQIRNYIAPCSYFASWQRSDANTLDHPWWPAVGPTTASVIAPDRMYTAQVLYEMAQGGYFEQTSSIIPSATSSICASIWARDLKPGTGFSDGRATLEVRTTGGFTLAQEIFDISTLWRRYYMPVSLTSSIYEPGTYVVYRIYPGRPDMYTAATASFWGAQLNSGSYPLPLAFTSGNFGGNWYSTDTSAEVTTPSEIFIPGVAGGMVSGSQGEVKVTWSSLIGSSEDRVVVDLVEHGTDVDRRLIRISGALGVVAGDIYGSDGIKSPSLTSSLTPSAATSAGTASLRWNVNKISTNEYADFASHGVDPRGLAMSFDGSTSEVDRIWVGQSSGSHFLFGTVGSIELLSAPYVTGSNTGSSPLFEVGPSMTAEVQVRFPTTSSQYITASQLSGVILTVGSGSTHNGRVMLWFERYSLSNQSGTLFLSSSAGRYTMHSASIFDDRWTNLAVVRDNNTGSFSIHVARADDGEISLRTSSYVYSGEQGFPPPSVFTRFSVGSTASFPSQMWAREARLWRNRLNDSEIDSHTIHYESYGREMSTDVSSSLVLYWRMNEGDSATTSGTLSLTDFSLNGLVGHGVGFGSGSMPYRKFLTEYHYIGSPDFGWTQNKVRVYDGRSVPRDDRPVDTRLLALEFNMIDQLNEDISRMNSSLEEMNDAIGAPRAVYDGYRGLITMRKEYFRRLTDKLNFRVFVDMLDFFDRSFVEAVRRVVPARSVFLGDEVVVESHMLERPRHQYAYRPLREVQFIIEGIIPMLRR